MKFIPLYSNVQMLYSLINGFTNIPVPLKYLRALGDKSMWDTCPGAAFEPLYIYNFLSVIKLKMPEGG